MRGDSSCKLGLFSRSVPREGTEPDAKTDVGPSTPGPGTADLLPALDQSGCVDRAHARRGKEEITGSRGATRALRPRAPPLPALLRQVHRPPATSRASLVGSRLRRPDPTWPAPATGERLPGTATPPRRGGPGPPPSGLPHRSGPARRRSRLREDRRTSPVHWGIGTPPLDTWGTGGLLTMGPPTHSVLRGVCVKGKFF